MLDDTLSDKNKVIYPEKNIYIDKPELYLLHKYENMLNDAKILDIGIGFGRTTHYFAKAAKEYVGVDYQKVPVDFCAQKYKNLRNAKFYVSDARDMKMFDENYFDFVLFSFNGIDYASPSDRLLILKEMKRVCKQNGIIYFSSLNLRGIDGMFSFNFSYNLIKFFIRLRRYILIRMKNPKINRIRYKLSDIDYALINSAQSFKLTLHYITPEKQIEQLVKSGFKDIKVISLEGIEVKETDEIKVLKDPWIYYSCRPEGSMP